MNHTSTCRPARTWVWVIVMIIILLPFVVIMTYRATGDRAFKKKIQAFETEGHPVTLDELNDRYTLPIGAENAADLYLDAFDSIVEWDKEKRSELPVMGQAELPARTERLPESMKLLIETYLQENQEALNTIRKASQIQHCRYPVDFSQGLAATMPWLSSVRDSARLLQLEALIHIDNNDVDATLENLKTNFALAQSINATTLVEQLVRIAVISLANRSIERLINQTALTDTQLQTLKAMIESEDIRSGLYRALQGECCMGLAIFQAPSLIVSNSLGSGVQARSLVLLRTVGYLQRDAISYLDIMQNYLNNLQTPIHEAIPKAQEINPEKTGGLITRILVPALGRVVQLTGRAKANQQTVTTACAIERYRLQHQQLPNTLNDLVPNYLDNVPKDPFDGKSLRYQKRSSGYVVYSIGEDGKDDGGKEKPQKTRDQTWDVTFIVER